MSYILFSNEGYYKPSQNLTDLFEELIRRPFRDYPSTPAWETEVRNKSRDYRRIEILERGRTDFDISFNGLTPEDKVLLYCIYYMPMHLYSSYHIYSNHLRKLIPENVFFIDIGCGPLTSGIAFLAATSECNITYIGIDRSQAMLNKACEINQYGIDKYSTKPFFQNSHFDKDYTKLPHLLESLEINQPNNTLIILNFCYVLASKTININLLSKTLNQIIQRYRAFKFTIVYQNPVHPSNIPPELSFLHQKWFALQPIFRFYKSQVDNSNVEEFCYNRYDFCNTVYYDLLYNDDMRQGSIGHATRTNDTF